MIIDAHAHLSDTDYGSLNLYLKQIAEAGVELGVVVAGGNDGCKADDRLYHRSCRAGEPDPPITSMCWSPARPRPINCSGMICIDPHQSGAAEALLESRQNGFRGLKLSPMSHKFSFIGRSVIELAAGCGEYGFPVYSHVLYNPGASTARFISLARQFPGTNFILGHMGFGPADQEGLDAAATMDNFFLETSTGSFLHIQEAIKRAGPNKVIFGSEFPLSHPKAELDKILLLDLTETAKDRILGGNIRDLLKL